MEKLIVIERDEKYQYKDMDSLIRSFINKDFYEMTEGEKETEMEKKAVANTFLDNIKIIKLNETKDNFEEDAFILYDEITYILSMLKFDKLILLERVDAEILGKYINREGITDNYIIINKFANEIMKKYLEIN